MYFRENKTDWDCFKITSDNFWKNDKNIDFAL